MNHPKDLARVFLQYGGETHCDCQNCVELRTALAEWIANSPISPDYTMAEAAEDFWLAVDAVDPLLTNSR